MDTVREIAITFCAAAVFAAALSLLHGRALEKSGRYIIALILLCSVIGAIAKGDFNLSMPAFNSQEEESSAVTDICEYQAEYLVAGVLREKGVTFENILAKATKNEDGSIIINEIEVVGTTEEQVIKALRTKGIDCRVICR